MFEAPAGDVNGDPGMQPDDEAIKKRTAALS